MIRLISVSKTYHSGQQALSQINLHLPAGELAFLTGHSGAGKTTLLKLIMMIERASRGQIILNGHNIDRIKAKKIPALRRQIGMIFQNPQLLPEQNIYQNVALPLNVAGYRPIEVAKRTRAALDKVGLLGKERHLPCELSSGEQQRVGIARAIVAKPAILLADEPTGNLDPDLAQEIMSLFQAFSEVGVTVLIATHDLALIAKMKGRVLTLEQGQLLTGCPPHALAEV